MITRLLSASFLLFAVGCQTTHNTAEGSGASTTSSGGSGPGPSGDSCTAADGVGCACDHVGQARACGGCADGQQVCGAVGEFNKWGECEGASTGCSTGSNPSVPTGQGNPNGVPTGLDTPDGGTPPGGDNPSPSPSPGPPACGSQCRPGTVRWCDDPVYCNFGQQTCTPDGAWGTCVEVTNAPPGCTPGAYDQACCAAAGLCCQDSNTGGPAWVGNCTDIACN